MNFDTCCRIFLLLPQKIADVYISMTSNASCEQLEEGEKKIPKAVSHSILYHKVIKKTIWLTFYKDYLIKQIDSMLPCVSAKKTSKYGDALGCALCATYWFVLPSIIYYSFMFFGVQRCFIPNGASAFE